jgi:hypothetical protein
MGDPVLLELLSEPEVRVGHFQSLMVMVWRGQIQAGVLAKTNAIEDALVKQFGKVSVLGVITNLAGGIPNAELRQAGADAMKHFQPFVRGTALVVASEGAKAVLARTFLAGMTLLINFESPLKASRTLGDALGWVMQLPGQDPALNVEKLIDAVETFVAQSRPPSR